MISFLVTGASGFLGKAILCELFLHKDRFITIGRQSTNDILCDLVSEVPIINVNIDCVIHAAGKAHSVPKTAAEDQEFFDVNLIGTNNLLGALERLDQLPKSFVFISSVAVYGCNEGTNIDEKTPLLACDPYGLSKIKAEQLVKNWCHENNVVCTILRLPLLIGKNPPGNLGAMLNGIKKGYYFNIDGGKAKKSMVLAEDVAKFIPKIKNIGGTYNLTDGSHPTFKDLSQTIGKSGIINLPLIIAKLLGCIGDHLGAKAPINSKKVFKITTDLTFDDRKAREFGWDPQNVLEYLKYNNL
jgi:nucleoside-diphosphate-sugar epimerase